MILPLFSVQRRTGPIRASRRGFTLIELLAVMAIILLLAGLILNIAGNAQYKAAMSRANAEIKQMENAMESYKVDNGTYPRDPVNGGNGTTDTLNAQSNTDPTTTTYTAASKFLFTQLSGLTAAGTFNKVYITFLPSQLYPTPTATAPAATGTTYIIDPFGFSYGYSTANQYAQDQNNASAGTVDATTYGYNPTFDLWSTAGYTPTTAGGGKTYPTSMASPTQYNTLWAKNW